VFLLDSAIEALGTTLSERSVILPDTEAFCARTYELTRKHETRANLKRDMFLYFVACGSEPQGGP
jgi:hypothetical protein